MSIGSALCSYPFMQRDIMRPARLRTIASLALLTLAVASARSQQHLFPDEARDRKWVASASLGMSSPFASDDFSTEWEGRRTIVATIEYYPVADAAFGLFGAHAMFDHSGWSDGRRTQCMDGVTREQYGGGLLARVYPVRWNGISLTLGGTVGAMIVTRERPIVEQDGSVSRIAPLPSSVDLAFGGTFGIESTLLPGASLAIEAGLEGTDDQVTLDESLVARASIRIDL
jgi:hypothetical protein